MKKTIILATLLSGFVGCKNSPRSSVPAKQSQEAQLSQDEVKVRNDLNTYRNEILSFVKESNIPNFTASISQDEKTITVMYEVQNDDSCSAEGLLDSTLPKCEEQILELKFVNDSFIRFTAKVKGQTYSTLEKIINVDENGDLEGETVEGTEADSQMIFSFEVIKKSDELFTEWKKSKKSK
jgi:hypothetical protein